MNPKLWLNRENLLHNLRCLKQKTSSSFVCPMVKANAYGVGDSLVVSTLLTKEIRHFGVARVFEAEKLRRAFPTEQFDILVFHPLDASDVMSYVQNKLTPVVSSMKDFEVLSAVDAAVVGEIPSVHLKFDLGMNRLGFSLKDSAAVKETLEKLNLKVAGVCGHFSTAGDILDEAGKSKAGLKNLIEVAGVFGVSPEFVHLPNSEALLKESFNIGIRPGISLYGVSGIESDLKGALRLTAPVVSMRKLASGDSVSYSGTWTAEKPSNLAILPIGYADGLRRGLSNRISFSGDGVDFRQVGTICMDYCMVLIDGESSLDIGSELTLFDEDLKGLYEWSKVLNTIPYEILTGLGNRVERKVV